MTRVPGDKPIEGHLQDLGFDPELLSDEERREIACAVQDCYMFGTGILAMIGKMRAQNPMNWCRHVRN